MKPHFLISALMVALLAGCATTQTKEVPPAEPPPAATAAVEAPKPAAPVVAETAAPPADAKPAEPPGAVAAPAPEPAKTAEAPAAPAMPMSDCPRAQSKGKTKGKPASKGCGAAVVQAKNGNTKLAKLDPEDLKVKIEYLDVEPSSTCPQGWAVDGKVGNDGSFRCKTVPGIHAPTNLIYCEAGLRYFAKGEAIGCKAAAG